MLTDARIIDRLECPSGRVRVVLDTDTFNEIDDQYALSLMVKCPEKFDIQAFTAAPFSNEKSSGPADGMEKSYREIMNLLGLLGREDLKPLVKRGSTRYLPDGGAPVDSEAAREIVRLANASPSDDPLYVIAIGAITNVASALLMDPSIADRMVVVWLGGNALSWPNNREFNLIQDVPAARVVLDARVPLVLLPCAGVVTHLSVGMAEIERHLVGRSALCDYLAGITLKESAAHNSLLCASRVIWDVAAVSWFFGGEYCQSEVRPSPIPTQDGFWAQSGLRHPIRYVYGVDRDRIVSRLFEALCR
jgi:inosine-uridine nucleoside N-ribohydrolase